MCVATRASCCDLYDTNQRIGMTKGLQKCMQCVTLRKETAFALVNVVTKAWR